MDKAFTPLSIAVLAVSDTRTLETDTAGALLKSLMEADGHRCAERVVCRDDIHEIRGHVMRWVNDPSVDAVITTGGTGFSGRDVTPEALEPLFQKRMDGFSVLFHQYSSTTVGTSTLQSRATGGLIGTTFVFVLPGSRGCTLDYRLYAVIEPFRDYYADDFTPRRVAIVASYPFGFEGVDRRFLVVPIDR